MQTIADTDALEHLLARLARIEASTERRWGTLTPGEMLCHLGDATASVLGHRVPPGPKPAGQRRPVLKWLALWTPLRWPRGVPTRPGVDPKQGGTRPTDFEKDRARAVAGLRELATRQDGLTPVHFRFGPMSVEDWRRWAWRHTDHHLRQFGL